MQGKLGLGLNVGAAILILDRDSRLPSQSQANSRRQHLCEHILDQKRISFRMVPVKCRLLAVKGRELPEKRLKKR